MSCGGILLKDSFDNLATEGQVISSEIVQFIPDDTTRLLPSPPLALESLEKTAVDRVHHVVNKGSSS